MLNLSKQGNAIYILYGSEKFNNYVDQMAGIADQITPVTVLFD